MKEARVYRSKDFYVGVILLSLGFPLIELDRSEGKFSVFVFSDEDGLAEETIKKYWDKALRVEPRTMVDSINELKTRLYSDF